MFVVKDKPACSQSLLARLVAISVGIEESIVSQSERDGLQRFRDNSSPT